MLAVVRGIVFAILGALLVFKLVRAARSGQISSRGLTFVFETSPIWFAFGVGCYVLLLIFCIGEILSAFGLIVDPAITVKAYFTGA
jgi:hypothetical protein